MVRINVEDVSRRGFLKGMLGAGALGSALGAVGVQVLMLWCESLFARRLLRERSFAERATEIAAWGRENDGSARGAVWNLTPCQA